MGVFGQTYGIAQFGSGRGGVFGGGQPYSDDGTSAWHVVQVGDIKADNGGLVLGTAGNGITIKGGRTLNAATLVAGTVTISDSSLASGDHIAVGVDTPGGTQTTAPYVSSRTNGTGFTITSSALDTSTVWYEITHQN